MAIATMLDAQAQQIRDNYEHTASFTAGTADPVAGIKCELEYVMIEQPGVTTSEAYAPGYIIECLLDDLPNDTQPSQGDIFTIASVGYTVYAIEDNTGRFVRSIVRT